MDYVGHMTGVRYSQLNPHRTLKQVRELEAALDKQNLETNQEKKINQRTTTEKKTFTSLFFHQQIEKNH